MYQKHLVSILLPTFNSELHLEDCIKSIIKQSYKNIELIIIYNLMRYGNLKSHKRMAYATLLYTDFFIYLRNDKFLRKTILKL